MSAKSKKYTIIIICLLVFIILSARLYKLQIIDQSQYGLESRKNSIRKIVVTPPRGLMFDNGGNIVVDNLPSYVLTIIPNKFLRSKITDVANLIDEDTASIGEIIDKPIGTNRFNPVIIKRRIDFKVISFLEENREALPGVDYMVESIRHYPLNYRGSHILGYIGEISDAMLEKQEGDYYRQGDLVGITGLEKYYEQQLRGEKGVKLVTADVNGRILGSYNEGRDDIAPLNGSDLYLTIDSELQKYCERLLGGRRGAIVAMNPKNGEILALVSKPDYDLTIFSGEKDNALISSVFNNPSFPMFNRVIQTRYPPGSTWKMMMGLAGLGSGKISTGSTIACGGSFTYAGRTFGDHGAYGNITIVTALEVSANVFFYKLSLMVGLENFTKYSKLFGFGSKTGIDLPNETSGLVPSREYFNKVYGEGKWGGGLLVNLGIGQGELGVSPIQMVAYTSAIAMDGLYSTPHLVRQIKNLNSGKDELIEIKQRQIELSKSYFQAVKRGMYLVVNGGGGTARNVKSGGYSLAGKTGTAQNTRGNNHSWFVGFAPYDNPQIAVCVFGENQGWGNEFAAPLAAAIMVRFLSNNSEDVYSELKSTPGSKRLKKKKINIFGKFDIFTLVLAMLITVLGIVSIYSATHGNTADVDYFKKQLIFAIIGFIIVIVVSFIQPRYIAIASFYTYIFALALLILVLLVGKTINGNKSWFYIAGFGIQPSEFAKIATILAISFYLNKGNEKKDINELPVLLRVIAYILIPTILIKLQNDTGTAIIFVAMMLPILWGAGLSGFMLFALITPVVMAILSFFSPMLFYVALAVVIFILFLFKRSLFASIIVLVLNVISGFSVHLLFARLELYQQKRILAVFDPSTDPLASGYNVIQSKVAIGSGGLYGKGFLQGTQTQLKFIPEQWTDFIFCMIGEEFGFIGSLIMVTLYVILIARILITGVNSTNSFLSLITVSVGGLFLIHLIINVGMTIGIMPVIGIPFPLVSYGVSSLLSFLLMIGFVMNNYRHRTQVI